MAHSSSFRIRILDPSKKMDLSEEILGPSKKAFYKRKPQCKLNSLTLFIKY